MPDHLLAIEAQRLTGDTRQPAQVGLAAETVERAVAAALTITDPDAAREVLPRVLRQLYVEIQPLIGAGLVNGSGWLDEQHRRLFAHAQTLFGGDAARIVQPPTTQPMPPVGRMPGAIFPR